MAYVRAFAVVAVILAHADLGGLYTLPVIGEALKFFSPFSFMIPVFFFASGYFFEVTPKIWNYVKKRFRRLVLPYYFWNLFYAVMFFAVTSAGLMQMSGAIDLGSFYVQPWVTGEQYVFNLAMWFVLTLFLVQAVYVAIRQSFARIKRLNEYVLFAVCLALSILGTYLSTVGWNDSIYLVVSRMLFGLPFVAFGYLYKVKLEKYDISTAVNVVVGAVLLLLAQYSLLQIYGNMDYDSLHVAFQGRLLQPFLSSFTGIWLCLQLSKVCTRLFAPKTWIGRGLKYVGDKSWDIMVHQFLGFWLLSATFLYIGAGGFDSAAFRTNIYYRYSIGGAPVTEVLYVLVGLVFPLVFSYLLTKAWGGLQAAFRSAWSAFK
jgi:fucose 4-O-acetylase-like acetyltransferase